MTGTSENSHPTDPCQLSSQAQPTQQPSRRCQIFLSYSVRSKCWCLKQNCFHPKHQHWHGSTNFKVEHKTINKKFAAALTRETSRRVQLLLCNLQCSNLLKMWANSQKTAYQTWPLIDTFLMDKRDSSQICGSFVYTSDEERVSMACEVDVVKNTSGMQSLEWTLFFKNKRVNNQYPPNTRYCKVLELYRGSNGGKKNNLK